MRRHPILLILSRNTTQESWNKHMYVHITSHLSFICSLYLVKPNNDFYGIQYSIKYTRHRISLPPACGYRIVLSWFRVTVKSGESCRSVSIPNANTGCCCYEAVSDCCLVQCLACSSMSSTRYWPAAWTAVCLSGNWWATFGTFALIIWKPFYVLLLTLLDSNYLMGQSDTMETSYLTLY